MTELTPNVPLLRSTLAWAEEQAKLPELVGNWFQGGWWSGVDDIADVLGIHEIPDDNCGTVFCFAGKVAIDAGGVIAVSEDGYRSGHYLMATQEEIDADLTSESWRAKAYLTPVVMVDDRAARLLGLDSWRASELFSSTNTIEDLRRIVGEIIERAESTKTSV